MVRHTHLLRTLPADPRGCSSPQQRQSAQNCRLRASIRHSPQLPIVYVHRITPLIDRGGTVRLVRNSQPQTAPAQCGQSDPDSGHRATPVLYSQAATVFENRSPIQGGPPAAVPLSHHQQGEPHAWSPSQMERQESTPGLRGMPRRLRRHQEAWQQPWCTETDDLRRRELDCVAGRLATSTAASSSYIPGGGQIRAPRTVPDTRRASWTGRVTPGRGEGHRLSPQPDWHHLRSATNGPTAGEVEQIRRLWTSWTAQCAYCAGEWCQRASDTPHQRCRSSTSG